MLNLKANINKGRSVSESPVKDYPSTAISIDANKYLYDKKLLTDQKIREAQRAKESKLKRLEVNRKLLIGALDQFRLDIGRYPLTDEGLLELVTNKSGLRGWNGPYVGEKYYEDYKDLFEQLTYVGHGQDFDLNINIKE